jgi:hypothetical protein
MISVRGVARAAVVALLLAAANPLSAEILTVPSNGSKVQSQPLLASVPYTIEASGTFNYGGSAEDAAWILRGAGWKQDAFGDFGCLKVNDEFVDWQGTSDGENYFIHTFSPAHVYRYDIVGSGEPVDFYIMDTYYGDNSGSLQVEVVPEPATLSLLALGGLVALCRRCRRK